MAIQPKATDAIKVNSIEAKTGSNVSVLDFLLVDVIKEYTGSARTTLFNGIKTDTIVERTGGNKVDFPDDIKTDVIAEYTAAAGVTIDGVLCKDNYINNTLQTYTPVITPTNITTTVSEVAGLYIKMSDRLMWFEVSWKDVVTASSSSFWYEDVPFPTAASGSLVGAFSYSGRNESSNIAEIYKPSVRVSWGSSANARVFWYTNPTNGTWRRVISGVYLLP